MNRDLHIRNQRVEKGILLILIKFRFVSMLERFCVEPLGSVQVSIWVRFCGCCIDNYKNAFSILYSRLRNFGYWVKQITVCEVHLNSQQTLDALLIDWEPIIIHSKYERKQTLPCDTIYYAPNFEKVDGAYCFWSVRAWVGGCVRHTFCTYCNV